MEPLTDLGARISGRTGKSLAWIGGVFATVAAVGVATVLAVVFAATVVVIGVMAGALVLLGGMVYRAKRARTPEDPTLIEARNVGGHSWVAYGWDQRGR